MIHRSNLLHLLQKKSIYNSQISVKKGPFRFLFYILHFLSKNIMASLEVIGAGFGRTGTDSLRTALNMLG